jgi:hypothetical protein
MARAREQNLRVLAECFSEAEWKWLIDNAAFARAISAVENLEDIERVSALGAKLLVDMRKEDSGRSRSRSRSATDD